MRIDSVTLKFNNSPTIEIAQSSLNLRNFNVCLDNKIIFILPDNADKALIEETARCTLVAFAKLAPVRNVDRGSFVAKIERAIEFVLAG